MSHAAVFRTCQIPDRSGLPSAVRGMAVAAGPCAAPPAAWAAERLNEREQRREDEA